MKRRIQIALIGSYSDLKYSNLLSVMAEKVGEKIAEAGAILVTGGERGGGLPEAATRGAKKAGGMVLGIVRDKKNALDTNDIIVQTKGAPGLREYVLMLSADAVIAINGGSGTLNEITVAYQSNIPVVVIKNSGGWSEKLANTYLDPRKRYRFITARSAEQAVNLAIKLSNIVKGGENT